jgi:hypothetical protein
MATNWASRRRNRDGVARSNEPSFRISPLPSAPAEHPFREVSAVKKMTLPGWRVETRAKIATRASSGPELAVD